MNLEAQSGFNQQNQDIPTNPFKKNKRFGGVQKSPSPINQSRIQPKTKPQIQNQFYKNQQEHSNINENNQVVQQDVSQKQNQPAYQPTRCNSSLIIMNFNQDNSFFNYGNSENSIAVAGTPVATPRQQSLHIQGNGQEMQQQLKLSVAEQNYLKQQQMQQKDEQSSKPIQAAGSFYSNNINSQNTQVKQSYENLNIKDLQINNTYKQKIQNLIQNEEETNHENSSEVLENIMMVNLDTFPDDLCNHQDHQEERIVQPKHLDFSKKSEDIVQQPPNKSSTISPLPLCLIQEKLKQNQKTIEEYSYTAKKSARSGSSDFQHNASQQSNFSYQTFYSPRMNKNTSRQGDQVQQGSIASQQLAQKLNLSINNQQQQLNPNSVNSQSPNLSNGGSNLAQPQTTFNNFGNQNFIQNTNRNQSPHSQQVTQNPFLKIQIANGINTLERQSRQNQSPFYKNISLNQLIPANTNPGLNNQQAVISNNQNTISNPVGINIFNNTLGQIKSESTNNNNNNRAVNNNNQINSDRVINQQNSFASVKQPQQPSYVQNQLNNIQMYQSLNFNLQFQQQQQQQQENIKQNNIPPFSIAPRITLSRQVSANSINMNNLTTPNNGFHTLQNIQNQNQIKSQIQALSASNIYNPNQISNLSVKLIEQSSNANSQVGSVPQTSVNLKQQPHIQNNQLKEPQTDKNIYNSSNVQNDFQEAVESVKRAAVERGKSASRVDENKTGSSQKQFVPLQGIEFPVINLDNKDKVDESYLKQIISPETLKILEEQKEIKKDIVKYRNINSPQSQGKSSQNNNDNTSSNSNSNGNNNNNNNNSNSSQQISSQNTLFSNTLSSPLAKLSNQPLGNIINVFGQLGNNNIQLSPNKQQQQQQVQQYNYQNIQDVFQNVQQNYQNLPILLNQSNLAKQIPSMQEPVLSQVFNKQKQPLNYQMPIYQMKPIQIQPPAPSVGLTLLSVQKNVPQPETPIQGISLLNLPQENKIIQKDIPSNNLSPSKESDKIQPQKSQAQNNLMNQKLSNISNQGEGQLTDQAKKDQNKQSGQLPEKTTILTPNQDELKNQNTRTTTAASQLHLNQLESKNQENNSIQNNQITQIKSFNLCYQTEKTEFDAEQDQPNKPKITQIIQSGRISQASSPKISERPQLLEVKSFPVSINQSQQQQLLNQRETFECVGNVDIKSIQIEDNQDKKLSNQNHCANNEIEAHMNYQNNVFAKQQNKAEQVEVVFTPQKDKLYPDPSQVESIANEDMNELESVKKALPNKLSPSYGYSPCFNIDKQDTQQSPNPITKINTNNTSNVLQSFGFNPYAIQQMQINEKAENNMYNSKENVNSINPILQTSNENQLLSPSGIESDNVPYVQNYNLNINNQQYFINSNFINNFQAPLVVGSINKTSFEYSELTNISDTKNIIIPGTEPIQKGNFNKSSSTNNINQPNPLQGNSNYIQIQLPQTNNQLKNNNQFDIQQNLTTESIEVDLSEKNNQQTYDTKQDLTPTLKRNMQNGLPMQTTPNNKQSQLSNKNSTPQTTSAITDKSIRQNNSNKINSVQNSKQKYTLSAHRSSKPEDMLHEQIMELQKQTKKMIEKSQQKIKSYSQERSSHNAKQVKAEAKSPMNFEKQVNKLTDNSQVGATFSAALNKGSSSCKNNYKDHQNIVPKAEISVRKDQEPNNGYNLNLKRNSSQDIQPMRSGSTQIKQSQQESNNSLQGSFNIQMAQNMNNSNNFQDKNPSILSSQTQFDTKSNSFKPKISSNTSIQSSINNSAQSKSQLKYYQNETINNLSSINSSRVNQNTSKQNNSSINSNFFQNQQNTNQLNIPLKLGMVPTIESDRMSKNDFNSQHQYIDLQNYSSTPLNSNTNISSLSNRNNNDFNNSQKTNNNQKGSQVNTNDKHKVACQWQTRSQIKNLLKMKQDTFFSHQGQSKSSMIPNDKKMNFKI